MDEFIHSFLCTSGGKPFFWTLLWGFDTFTGYSSVQAYNIEIGPISAALYLMYYITPSYSTAFVKVNSDGSQAWSKSVGFQTVIKSLAVDKTENSAYFIKNSGNPMIVGRLKTLDGTLIDSQSQ